MVAKIVTGTSIKGVLNYNEKKVQTGNATLLDAPGYLKPAENLSFSEKLERLQMLALLHETASVNCVHTSINFDGDDRITRQQMLEIAGKYLERIGFGGQPYLVYEHHDAAHRHLHLITTNIRSDSTRISLHNIGRDRNMKACRELEKEYGLVNAATKKQPDPFTLRPVPEKVVYGKSATKAAISNTVRAVVRDYKFTSLTELNAVLKGFNVEAYRGEPGTKMFEKKGLVYQVLDKKGNRVGVPIKSSSIYSSLTLSNLEKQYEPNKEKRSAHKSSLAAAIDRVLRTPVKDRFAFRDILKKEGINVLFRENEHMVYGITFVDHKTKCVFNGSDLGKGYTAKRLLERMAESGTREQVRQELIRKKLQDRVRSTDYSTDARKTLEVLYAKGFQLETGLNDYGHTRYYLSLQDGDNGIRAGGTSRFDHYFEQAGITGSFCHHLSQYVTTNGTALLQDYLHGLFAQQSETVFGHITPDKKKPKRKVNW